MKSLTDGYVLSNGVKVPCIGFGMFQVPDGKVAVDAAKEALKAGYRHIDTAAIYQNEREVGIAVKESGIKREDIFVTSKLWNNVKGYDDSVKAFNETMKKLDMDYLDLYLIHWPNPVMYRDCWQERNAENWRALEDLYKAGKIRAIGVSNFMIRHIEELKKTAKIIPMANQIRVCPGETHDELRKYCNENNILVQAYSPLGAGSIFEYEEMKALSKKYNKTIAQICIRFSLQIGCNPLPKSVTPSRIAENTDVFDFVLEEKDVEFISKMANCCGGERNPDKTDF